MSTFKKFLTESIVTVYHGTNHQIKKFTGIVYFTPQEDAAQGYARGKVRLNGGKAYVYEIKLDLKKVKQFSTMQAIGSLDQKLIEKYKKDGFDGAYYDGSKDVPIIEYVPFYPENLKIEKVYQVNI